MRGGTALGAVMLGAVAAMFAEHLGMSTWRVLFVLIVVTIAFQLLIPPKGD